MPATKIKIECPVCDMEVSEKTKLKAEYKGRMYYFCSEDDMKKFQQRPQVYGWKAPGKTSKVA